MKASEFLEVLRSTEKLCGNREWSEDVNEGLYYFADTELGKKLKELGYVVKAEEHFGGEGQGDQYWLVFSVDKHGVIAYFKIDGWYASFHGGEYEDPYGFYEVEEVEVMIKEWHRKK